MCVTGCWYARGDNLTILTAAKYVWYAKALQFRFSHCIIRRPFQVILEFWPLKENNTALTKCIYAGGWEAGKASIWPVSIFL